MKAIRHIHNFVLFILSVILCISFLLLFSSDTNHNLSLGLENYSALNNNEHLKATKPSNLVENLSNIFGSSIRDNVSQDNVHSFSSSKFHPSKTFTLIGKNMNLDVAPNKNVLSWTFNGTMPGPTIKIIENQNITVKFINQSPNPHTIHFHGFHDELNDGVGPMVLAGQTYLYNITGQPAGVLLYYCDVMPTSQHIKMGMYGALLVEPKNHANTPPAKEFLMVLSEFNVKKQNSLIADYYLVNGYADQYLHYPIGALQNELVRIYIVNAGTNLPVSLHFHGTLVKNYPSGLLVNNATIAQSVLIGPGDASIVEAKWKDPGNYLFHSNGYQQEHGSRGMIKIFPNIYNADSTAEDSNNSQIERQYKLQLKLQEPNVPSDLDNYTISKSIHQNPFNLDSLLKRSSINNTEYVSIAMNSALPNNDIFYSPSTIEITKGQEVRWTNNDNFIHTVTSGDPSTGGNGEFDSGTIEPNKSFTTAFMNEGEYNYYCIYHPWMFGSIVVK